MLMPLLNQFLNPKIHNLLNLESRTLRTESFIWSRSSPLIQQMSILLLNLLNKKCFWENLKKWERLLIKYLTNKILILQIFNNCFNTIKLSYCSKVIKLKLMLLPLISSKFLKKFHMLMPILFLRLYWNFLSLLLL